MRKYKKYLRSAYSIYTLFKNVIVITLLISLSTVVFAQDNNQFIVIQQPQATVSEVFKVIEEQADYRFARDGDFDAERVVKLTKERYSLTELLNILIRESGRNYMIDHKTVIIQKPSKYQSAEIIPTREEDDTPYPQSVLGSITSLSTGAPLSGASVALSGRYKRQTITDSQGYFSFDGIPTGTYEIVVTHPNHLGVDGEFFLANNEAKRLLFGLQYQRDDNKEYTFSAFVDQRNYTSKQQKTKGLSPFTPQRLPLLALKTNLLYDAMTSFNLGVELRLSKKMTLDIPVNWKPYHTGSAKKMFRHFMVQPEVRWWNEVFNGHFLGVHGLYSQYNIGGIKLPFGLLPDVENTRYEGDMYGVGLSYGYHAILSNRISLEFTAGMGYVYLDYGKFNCRTCRDKIGSGTKHYVGPTKLGVTLILMLR